MGIDNLNEESKAYMLYKMIHTDGGSLSVNRSTKEITANIKSRNKTDLLYKQEAIIALFDEVCGVGLNLDIKNTGEKSVLLITTSREFAKHIETFEQGLHFKPNQRGVASE